MSNRCAIVAPPCALEALRVLSEAGRQAYLVGGCVRDSLRGADAHDVDITTDALWEDTERIFAERGYRVSQTGIKHGTVTVYVDAQPIEITTFRTDGAYADHRRPSEVRFVTNVTEDLARRDFTINAMAWNPEVGLVDPFGGADDLRAGIVRAVGDARTRFEEDALRILRGVRFASKLGFSIEAGTSAAIHACAPSLEYVAIERRAVEYDGIVQGKGAVEALRAYVDVVAHVVPEFAALVGFEQHSPWHCFDVWEHTLHALEFLDPAAGPLVRHAAMLHDIGKPECYSFDQEAQRGHFYGHERVGARIAHDTLTHLCWPHADITHVTALIEEHDRHIPCDPRGVRRTLARLGSVFPANPEMAPVLFEELCQLKRADAMAHAPGKRHDRIKMTEDAMATFREVMATQCVLGLRDLAIGGHDLMDLGLQPGPRIGTILQSLLVDVIEGTLENTHEALLAEARTYL